MRFIKIIRSTLLSLSLLPVIGSSIFAQWSSNQYRSQDNGVARFRWQGRVDGTTFVKVRGRQVLTETPSGLPVQNQQFDFTDSLPRTRIDVELAEVQGRGRVSLIEDPSSRNEYTAVVRIDDDGKGASQYSFELRWVDLTRRDRDSSSDDRAEEVNWRGRVDGTSLIRFRRDQVTYQTQGGNGVSSVSFRFSYPLPSRDVNVSLNSTEGRGEVLLVEQPNRENNYTASVRIRDDKGGAGFYSFTLTWTSPRGGFDRGRDFDRDRDRYRDNDRHDNDRHDNDRHDNFNNNSQGAFLRWSGRIDGRDVLYIRGDRLRVEHQAGQGVSEENYRFFRALPFERRTVLVRKVNGRGGVAVVQQPTRENGFTAAIAIDDRDGGSDRYEIEVFWQ